MRSVDYDEDGGRANACCMGVFSFITMILCLCLWGTISFYMDANFCHRYYYCCTLSCFYRCVGTTCSGGEWFTVRPIEQDMLPPPMNVSQMTGSQEVTAAGDGEVDYWSLGVAAILGPISSLLAICFACGAASARSPPAGLTGVGVLCAGLMKVGCAVCIGIQFCSSYNEGQWVFNYFSEEQYQIIYTSVMYYWIYNYYYGGFGSLLCAAFTFLIISCIWETLFGLTVMCTNDSKYTGVKEWETEINYANKKTRRERARAAQYTTNANPA